MSIRWIRGHKGRREFYNDECITGVVASVIYDKHSGHLT
jgi:hypothetical protein